MIEVNHLLMAVPYTEPASFFELCNTLRDMNICPEKGDKLGWKNLFETIRQAESDGHVEVDRDGDRLQCIQLTESGRSLLKQYLEMKGKV